MVGKEGNRQLLPTSFADVEKIEAEMGKEEFRGYVNRVYAAILRHPPYEPLDIESRCTPQTKRRFLAVLWLYLAEGHGGYFDNEIKHFTRYDDPTLARVRREILDRKYRRAAAERNREAAEKERDSSETQDTPHAPDSARGGDGKPALRAHKGKV